MHDNEPASSISVADILDLNAIGEAIAAEWYPHRRPGDPMPAQPPEHIMREASDLALRHRMIAAQARGTRAA